jgi:flagellar hook-basal body complex protein FliE
MNLSSINSSISQYSSTPKGNQIGVNTTDPLHFGNAPSIGKTDDISESFSEVLKKSLEKVNDTQVTADDLTQKMIYNPNSVEAHEVMIASEKARISLTFTKTVVDGIIRAYRDLTNLR